MSPRLSIIIPTLNEAGQISATLQALQFARDQGHEVIVVDGGSDDETPGRCAGLADHIVTAERGRARQMNAGAKLAQGQILWFLHADTRMARSAVTELLQAVAEGALWGRFDVRLDSRLAMLRLVGFMMNRRSRLTGMATGDQGIFVQRARFEAMGGFADIPLMEDIEISQRLRRLAPPACLTGPLVTSARRWEQHGVWRTIGLMWSLRFAYWRGVDPHTLAGRYR